MSDEKEIFSEALEIGGEERAAYLERACGGDEALRARVERLLRNAGDEGFLEPDREALGRVLVEEEGMEAGESVTYFGDYELEGKIASGAMGVVYRARQVSLNRAVALKMIRGVLVSSESDVARFRAEAEAAGSLDHPNIVPIYEVGEHQGQQYFTMKLVEGGTLAERMGEFRRRPRAAAGLMVKVARAVHEAHQHGILHRDLKPGNILVDEAAEPHVTDFGLAKELGGAGGMTVSGQILGTPYYMAPEQAAGRATLTTAVDVYSLGVVSYELLSGRVPFDGGTVLETMRMVKEEVPPRLEGVERDLGVIVGKCLEKRPGDRYGSAEELADDLERWLRGEPIAAREVAAGERLVMWVRRKPVHASAVLLGCVLVLVLAVGGPWVGYRQSVLKGEAEAARELAEERAAEIEKNLYAAEMNLAGQAAATMGGSERVAEVVGRWVPDEGGRDLRGWEWYLLNGRTRRGRVVESGGDMVRDVDVRGRDGALVESGLDAAVRVRDGESLEVLATVRFEGAGGMPRNPKWSRDGRWVLVGDMGGSLRLIDSEAGDERAVVGVGSELFAVAVSPVRDEVAVGVLKGGVRLFAFGEGGFEELARDREGETVQDLAWSGDGEVLAGTRATVVQFWNRELLWLNEWDTGREVFRIDWAGGTRRVVVGCEEGVVEMREAASGEVLRAYEGLSRAVMGVAWQPGGSLLAAAGLDQEVLLWDGETGVRSGAGLGHTRHIDDVAWSADGKRVISVAMDRTLREWTLKELDRPVVMPPRSRVSHIARGGEPGQLLCCSMQGVRAFDGGGGLPAGLEGKRALWIESLPGGKGWVMVDNGDVVSVVGADGEERALGRWARRYSRATGLSGDGRRFACVTSPGVVTVWDVTSGAVLAETDVGAEVGLGVSMDWHPAGRLLACGGFGQLLLMDTDSGEVVERLRRRDGEPWGLDWRGDGEVLAGGLADRTVVVWERGVDGGWSLRVIGRHSGIVQAVAWSPDGSRLASGGLDGSIKIWEPDSGVELLAVRAGEPGTQLDQLVWSDDGRVLYSRSIRSEVRRLDARAGYGAEGR